MSRTKTVDFAHASLILANYFLPVIEALEVGAVMHRQINPDELDDLYCLIGKCIWYVQYVEDALHTLLALRVEIKVAGVVAEEQANELLAKHRRSTLGTALRIAKEHNALPGALFNRLTKLKGERDWLVHRSQNQDGKNLYTESGRKDVLERLESLYEETKFLQLEIAEQVHAFVLSCGVKKEQIEEIANQKIAELLRTI